MKTNLFSVQSKCIFLALLLIVFYSLPAHAATASHSSTIIGYSCQHHHHFEPVILSASTIVDHSEGMVLPTINCRVKASGTIGNAVVASFDSGTIISNTTHVQAYGEVGSAIILMESSSGTAYFMGSPWSSF